MGTLLPILTLLVVVFFALLITRVATVALTLTGISRDLARFQARSAFLGVGFTTGESERVLEHPVRRRIIMILMFVGNAGFVLALSSLIPVFITMNKGELPITTRLLWLGSGMALLGALANSTWIDRQLSRAIESALKRWTRLEVRDYHSLLQLGHGYAVSEVGVEADDWLAGKNLGEIRLGDEGVQVLGIRRVDGEYVGAPTGKTYLRKGDMVTLYGLVEHLAELDTRHAGSDGDMAHARRVEEQNIVMRRESGSGRYASRDGGDGS